MSIIDTKVTALTEWRRWFAWRPVIFREHHKFHIDSPVASYTCWHIRWLVDVEFRMVMSSKSKIISTKSAVSVTYFFAWEYRTC